MSRRINTGKPVATEQTFPAGQKPLKLGGNGADDYLLRLAKYVPAEIIGLYIVTSGIVPEDVKHPNNKALWIVFGFCFLLVPIYMWFATTAPAKKPLWPQILLGTIAFPVWVFAIGGPFKQFGWYQGWKASIAVAFVTVLFGLYKPTPGS